MKTSLKEFLKKLLSFGLLSITLQSFFSVPVQAQVELHRQWSRSTLSKPYDRFRVPQPMSPLLTPSLVIQGNGVDGIRAYNRKSGHMVWSLDLPYGVEAGATLQDGKLYFGSNDGFFYCVDGLTGKRLWRHDLQSQSLAKPLIQGSSVYHVSGRNTLYAFHKDSGRSLWVKTHAPRSPMTVRGQSSPVYEKGLLYLGFSDGGFSAINAQTGREVWSKTLGDDKRFNDVDGEVVITPSCLLISSYANSLYCLDKKSGAIRWRYDKGGLSEVTLSEGKILYPTVAHGIHILEESSGKPIGQPLAVKGMATKIQKLDPYILYGESKGALVVRHKKSLAKVAEFAPGMGINASPQVDPKTKQIYIMSNDANLYRLDLTSKTAQSFLWSEP